MKRSTQGRYVAVTTAGEEVRAFVPSPLPPKPAVVWTSGLRSKFDQALVALGRLDSVSQLIPESSLFLYMYVRKEAVLSSMIEGTQSSLSDLMLHEIGRQPSVPMSDIREVSNYVASIDYGLRRLSEGFPLSARLLREIHEVLLRHGRGSMQAPGEFRRSQNWIGGTRPGNAAFVPPPAGEIDQCMSQLERFIHDRPEPTPVLLKAALAHVQFETIHPFLDGNGRLGRLLITLILCGHGVLREPMLYLSLYFKTHRTQYYQQLMDVRLDGDWERWLDFFADAVLATAGQAVETAQGLLSLADRHRELIGRLGRASASALKVHRLLMLRPITTSTWLVEKTGITPATVNSALEHLSRLGIVRELTAQKRNRVWSYSDYFGLLNRGTELPPG